MKLDKQLMELARQLSKITDCKDPVDLRNAVENFGECDHMVHLEGYGWRIIPEEDIDEIMQEELSHDEYILGCFNADFLAGVTGLPIEMIKACQEAERFEAIGQAILDLGYLETVQKAYAQADGYGHHFSGYDGETHEMFLGGKTFYVFNCG